MNPPELPPPFPTSSGLVRPPKKGLSTGVIVLIVVGLVVALVGGLALMALPAYQRIQKMAQEIRKQQNPAPKPPPPLTPEQKVALEKFGTELAAAISESEFAKVLAFQDSEGLASRVFEKLADGLPNSAAVRKGFVDGIRKREGGWMWSLFGSEVRFLRARERDGFPCVLLRVKSGEGAVNYVDILARPDCTGFRAFDMFNYVFGTLVSEESRNALAALVSKSAGSGFAAMFGMPKMDETVFQHMNRINEANAKGDAKELLRLCDSLPPELKTQRTFFILRLQALMNLSATDSDAIDAQYKDALRAAPDILGKDSTTDLLMVDLLFLDNDLKGAEACLKRVEDIIGGDPYLKFLRGGTRLQMKDYAGVLELADQAAKEDPTMASVVDLRISVHRARKDHQALADELRAFKRHFGHVLDRKSFADDPEFAEFLASPQFAAWEKEIQTN